eukprot:CAMPEP_0179361214 /NCGR_PEP_ID=MMETSP0797-20121207/80380_1 /TAXON_ID=47934 /ORGANISM="Dinophysis acuminata, Strain DAEP01" /LENGTH=217 /DNA_ID=CAMNT_0021076599 /DNA_START=47 /DNA_END=697 /DNA_ORIENTATION=+
MSVSSACSVARKEARDPRAVVAPPRALATTARPRGRVIAVIYLPLTYPPGGHKCVQYPGMSAPMAPVRVFVTAATPLGKTMSIRYLAKMYPHTRLSRAGSASSLASLCTEGSLAMRDWERMGGELAESDGGRIQQVGQGWQPAPAPARPAEQRYQWTFKASTPEAPAREELQAFDVTLSTSADAAMPECQMLTIREGQAAAPPVEELGDAPPGALAE